ncbi:flagellar assembly protein FliW [Anaerosacchariphilus polymeriproducens]|uniref:Flagellar assembly factor FliW n=1 Tax=Anaerosacchariphilus polymeriproducens TaxID=1812858 RepID=A0A371AQU8_9FIRM|nr:flagellar assembly protein FliW [Anaerosacchariphilus polymeriproducens]RDU21902.1 flagellar assembly protein FliW [Anaerosacchariphilus polymeriproducens]
MEVKTRLFGTIEVKKDKQIHFVNGIIGFPEMQDFTLVFEETEEGKASISWLQSIQEPDFALPVMDPLILIPDYNPVVEDELLKPLGEMKAKDTFVMVTVTVPEEMKDLSVNLKAPLIINAKTRKACQIIVDNQDYSVKYPIYDILTEEKAGE